MGDKSKIEWCDATWNPVTGCTPVSEGCENCYAKRLAGRFPQIHGRYIPVDREYGSAEFEQREFSEITLHHDRLNDPLHWRKPRRIFVCSMGDLFHEQVPEGFIFSVWNTFLKAPQHTYMVLTKRPKRMMQLLRHVHADIHWKGALIPSFPLPNVWLGVTVENDKHLDRIFTLLEAPAPIRFVSTEPLLGPLIFGSTFLRKIRFGANRAGTGPLDWVIVGAETGPGARLMNLGWARSIRDQCKAAGVPFFFKSAGPQRAIPKDLMIREFPKP
jgi:protein gp37